MKQHVKLCLQPLRCDDLLIYINSKLNIFHSLTFYRMNYQALDRNNYVCNDYSICLLVADRKLISSNCDNGLIV